MKINQHLDKDDLFGRYGGDEFAVLMRDLTLREAEARFRLILDEISSTDFEYGHEEIRAVHMTVSCGLADYLSGDSSESLIQRADQAM